MATRIDWDYWRIKFVQGPDDLDLKRLSEYSDAPAYSSLRNRSSKEDWPDQRKRYRANLSTVASTVPDVKATAQQVTKIIDAAEMLTQHNMLAKAFISKAAEGLQHLRPATMKPSEIAAFAKLGVDIQRITEGLATQRTELDLKSMTDAELQALVDNGQ